MEMTSLLKSEIVKLYLLSFYLSYNKDILQIDLLIAQVTYNKSVLASFRFVTLSPCSLGFWVDAKMYSYPGEIHGAWLCGSVCVDLIEESVVGNCSVPFEYKWETC